MCRQYSLDYCIAGVTLSQEIVTAGWAIIMASKEIKKAIAYLRTSSAANLGADKDTQKRQRIAIATYAKAAGYELVDEFTDEAVSGADPIDARPGFIAALARIKGNGVRTIIVENASRFARDLLVQEAGHAFLKREGIDLIAADSPDTFLDQGPTATLIRQVLGAVSQFEKAMLVAKLAGARARKKALTGEKVTGRKSHAEMNLPMVLLAKKLARYPVDGRKRSLREIAAELDRQGFKAVNGSPLSAVAVKRMIENPIKVKITHVPPFKSGDAQ